MISIKGLHKFFNKGNQNEIHVINGVDLELPDKGMVAIFGKSGCGKTTLLNVIGGLDGFAEGEISIEGQPLSKNTDDIRNRYVGYIFQNYNLCKNESCFDNVAAALKLCGMTDEDEIKTRVTAALRNVGLENYAKRPPDTLSGGQQQRVAIARAIVKNPKIILADEPTGNLDEINTVMVMDLLKAISKEHLVLLVTHEANLVDHYCDKVIELSDGSIVEIKDNESANGFEAKNKNDIYLGELEKKEFSANGARVEYYGDAPDAPINIKIVNKGGKIYLKVGTEKVHILDESSEVKLREGVYETRTKSDDGATLDMSALTHVEATKTGRLFTFKSSIKSGYAANFSSSKKGKKFLKRFMALFSAVIVFMSAVFGTAFKDIKEASDSYNHNAFYLSTPDGKTSEKLTAAVGSAESGIDSVRLTSSYPMYETEITFKTGNFETFKQYDYSTLFNTNAVFLELSLAEDKKLIEGKKDNLESSEIVITSKIAEKLIEKSSLGYIKKPHDLLGLVSSNLNIDGAPARIVGIVESDENAVYLTEMALAKYVHSASDISRTALASSKGIKLADGETALFINNNFEDLKYPALNEEIEIQGKTFKVVMIKESLRDYGAWLVANSFEKQDSYAYFAAVVKAEKPEIVDGTEEFSRAIEEAREEKYFDYFEYYYSEIGGFINDLYLFDPYSLEAWLYTVKGVDFAKYYYLSTDFYIATVFKEANGRYPTLTEYNAISNTISGPYEELRKIEEQYSAEFYYGNHPGGFYYSVYLVSDSDYIELSKRMGNTHSSASTGRVFEYEYNGEVSYEYYETTYTMIHSSDPKKTEAWLYENFPDSVGTDGNRLLLITPSDVRENSIKDEKQTVVSNLIAMAVILVMMCVCMYFIMRSTLMNRIKEVGILRAIGVSRKNLIFKFFIEAALLAALTVTVGYLLSSAFIAVCLGNSSIVSTILYYPLWLAICVFLTVTSATLFFGTLPTIMLLRKTPSEILSKYDI